MSLQITRWISIDPDERDVAEFDFSLAAGQASISSVTVSVELQRGTDPTPEAMLIGSPAIYEHLVVQRIAGRLAGVVYKIRAKAVFSDAREHVLSAVLPCERR